MLAQFRYDATVLGPTLRSNFATRLEATRTNVGRDYVQRTNFSVATADIEQFETTLDWDSTVTAFSKRYEGPERLIYHVEYQREILETLGYLAALDCGGEFLHAHTESSEWVVRMLFPNRQAFGEFVDQCHDYGLELDIDRITDADFTPDAPEYGLTETQRETLLTAYAMGYFSVPQETTLEAVSDELGVSVSAVSGRLHRGLTQLIGNALDAPK
ncbi:hypothetical protein SAMN05216226_101251 [Halovenus aranensis]|jgi:predicted DNA binding protein|uniref:HTH bat-type domain-containing protein n=1 Tax=Halovenus aranensis TaxID=890420 RepID=A0A1G8S2U7_9EURY|nr:helix-turn-helix domain-containing protein [Halovenus aranensis]SDJ23481.1 hypothetical protein SAMN05216226_101251 [Halovenus aranensis]